MNEIYNKHVQATAKRVDYELYLSSLLLPQPQRLPLWVLLSLDHELARIPSVTEEEMIRMIRFTWWREAVEEAVAGKPTREHETAAPLAELLKQNEALHAPVHDLLQARHDWLFQETGQEACEAKKWACIAALRTCDGATYTQYAEVYAMQKSLRLGECVSDFNSAREYLDTQIEGLGTANEDVFLRVLRFMLKSNQKRLHSSQSRSHSSVLMRPALSTYAYIAYVALQKRH